MAQLDGHCSTKQKVTGSIPGQGTCLGVGLVPGQDAYKRQLMDVSHIDVPFPLFSLPFPLKENEIKKENNCLHLVDNKPLNV